MLLKLNTLLKNRAGETFQQTKRVPYYENEEGVPVEKQRLEVSDVSLGRMLEEVLLKKGSAIGEDEIMGKYELFRKIEGKEEVELDKTEVELLKLLVCETFEVFFIGQIIELIK